MAGFIEGAGRQQAMLFPETPDDYVGEANPVRVVDAFVEMLDLAVLGFRTAAKETGRPGCHPGLMLRICVFGHLNRIQSSRRLETEWGRNLNLIWLTGRLRPDFKTIADLRKEFDVPENGAAIRKVCRQFVLFCGDMSLLDADTVAIDGSRFKAVNAKSKSFTLEKLRRKTKDIDAGIARYMVELDRADAAETESGQPLPKGRLERLARKLAFLVREAEETRAMQARMEASGETQVSLTDPDARAMTTTARHPRVIGYNVQSVVDAEHHLIVAHEVTMQGFDRGALSGMAIAAQEVMTTDDLHAVADKGYYRSEQLLACERAGITATVPKPNTSGAGARGQYDRADFVYDAESDTYRCPAGKALTYRYARAEDGLQMRRYWTNACPGCPLKSLCTTGTERRMRRWEHEDVLERVQQRIADDPLIMRIRRQTVEHPFGTIKAWMGATHFTMKRLKNVATEMALHVLAYNMKRVMKILGLPAMLAALQASTAPAKPAAR